MAREHCYLKQQPNETVSFLTRVFARLSAALPAQEAQQVASPGGAAPGSDWSKALASQRSTERMRRPGTGKASEDLRSPFFVSSSLLLLLMIPRVVRRFASLSLRKCLHQPLLVHSIAYTFYRCETRAVFHPHWRYFRLHIKLHETVYQTLCRT